MARRKRSSEPALKRGPRAKLPRMKRTYTSVEAAAVLGVTARTVRTMMNDGRLEYFRTSSGRRLSTSSLWALLRHGHRAAWRRAERSGRYGADGRAQPVGVE